MTYNWRGAWSQFFPLECIFHEISLPKVMGEILRQERLGTAQRVSAG